MCPFAHSLTLSSNATALLPQKQISKNRAPQQQFTDAPTATLLLPYGDALYKNRVTIFTPITWYYNPPFSLRLVSTSRLIL
jgi:hypothetical protein